MITKEGKVINGMWNYGVLDEEQNRKKGCIESILSGLKYNSKRIVTKLSSYKYFQVINEYS